VLVTTQQILLSLVLALMVFAVALELTLEDFKRVAAQPRNVLIGLVPQFILLPIATWLLTLALDLPPAIEAAMILVACCPGGSLSNVITHFGRGNTALSVSISALASVVAIAATPLNFAWMIAANPATANWLKSIKIDPSGIWVSLVMILAVPLALGLVLVHKRPNLAARLRKPLANFSLLMLFAFILLGLAKDRQLLNAQLLLPLLLVVGHNALGLLLGWSFASLMRCSVTDRRAITIEGGMQNAGLALGIIGLQFEANAQMVILASLWGIWHIVSGLGLAMLWRQQRA
jgi:bile acid:Na+ symporter, BASS family